MYLADTGNTVYQKNRSNCVRRFRRLTHEMFVYYVIVKMKSSKWYVDTNIGEAQVGSRLNNDETVCNNTIYNCIDIGLIENANITMKPRIDTKSKRVRVSEHKFDESIENLFD